MKFFKYLIFISLSLFSVSAFSAIVWRAEASGGYIATGSTAEAACAGLFNLLYPNGSSTYKNSGPNSSLTICTYSTSSSGGRLGDLTKSEQQCVAGSSNVYSGSVTIQNWKDNDEWLNLNDAMLAKFTGTTVCANSCVHKFDFLGSGEGDSTNGPVSFKGKYVSTAQTCTSPTQGPTDTLNGTKTPTTEGCKSGEAYCNKPPTGCPSGYTSGSFNGKEICVKNNPDPTKPNPNDPNNNSNNSNFDDSKIIAAINDSKTAITNSINNAV
ncbi:MAG: hypothetical protein L0G61_06070, partial [Staphylococcus equorum]|nr:hypothetical protein [Staphylococcus equorum]